MVIMQQTDFKTHRSTHVTGNGYVGAFLLSIFSIFLLFSYGYDLSVEIEEMLCGFVDTFLFDLSDALNKLLESNSTENRMNTGV